MSSSQMEKYVWASILYYVVVAAFCLLAIFISINGFGIFWGLVALFGCFAGVKLLNAWRLRRHPRSMYQVELAKRRVGGLSPLDRTGQRSRR
ncbi:hypothetical protein EB233_11940 [Mesorhizobium erdmanii]|uniref:Uncharacterized protein n=1 Tax=Mesorhizobium erdmanii TaxID=1777866 RepID=A0A6M7UFV9_9HYPH|nr:hypothetical protein EB233_11940 [Mesorhizobium erdmanii]